MLQVFWLVLNVFALMFPSFAQAAETRAIASLLSPDTRLMVFSPHPDDESLGAAGLIQEVLKRGGKVQVVFVTNGDGFPEGVQQEERISHPTAKDYRKYGDERRGEALEAAGNLGLKSGDMVFLGFPDGGLSSLLLHYCSGPQAYKSPFTRKNCPPALEIIIPNTVYTGNDLTREIEKVMADFRPDLAVTTARQDEHPDHSATYFFVKQAMAQLRQKYPEIKPRLLTFLIHFGQWPIAQGAGTGSRLYPPEGFPAQGRQWVSLPLPSLEMAAKRLAILQYHSQMLIMDRYLLSFARSNELFIIDN